MLFLGNVGKLTSKSFSRIVSSSFSFIKNWHQRLLHTCLTAVGRFHDFAEKVCRELRVPGVFLRMPCQYVWKSVCVCDGFVDGSWTWTASLLLVMMGTSYYVHRLRLGLFFYMYQFEDFARRSGLQTLLNYIWLHYYDVGSSKLTTSLSSIVRTLMSYSCSQVGCWYW